jgi:hypothetical protein
MSSFLWQKEKMDSSTIQMWLSRIERCENLQGERTKERLQAIKLYTSSFLSNPTNDNTDLSDVNFVYEYVKVMVAAAYARDPYIFCRTKVSTQQSFCETMERVCNVYWKKLQMKSKIKKSLLDAILQPPGFIHLGYMLITEVNQLKKSLEQEFPELKSDKPSKTESQEGILDETVKKDDIFANFISTWNVLWPDGYHDIRDCPYLIVKQKMSLEDLYNCPLYGDLKYQITPSDITNKSSARPAEYKMKNSHPPKGMTANEMDKELIDVTLFHVYDRRGQKIFTVVKNFTRGTLMEKDWPFLSDGFPTFPLILNEIPATDEKANSYPLSDIVPMLPQLKELSYISSAMNRHRKRSGTLLLTKKGLVTASQATNIQNAHDLDMVELESLSEENIKGFTPPSLPNDFYNNREIILEDLMRVSGYNQLLGSVRGVNTATESENVRAGALLRQNERIDIIEDFVVSIARFMAGMLWQFKTRDQVSELLGEEVSNEMWPDFPEDKDMANKVIDNDLYFEIEAGSTQPPKDVAVERKQWSDLVAQIKAAFPNRLKDDVILGQLLKKYDFKDIDNAIIKYDDEEVATAQKENEYLLQGIPQVVGPNENDMLHLQVHSQSYQVPGMEVTPQMDEHVNAHMESMQRKNPSQFPQKGDTKVPSNKGASPEITRGGVPDMSDFLGQATSQAGMGKNIGGRRGN